MHLTRSILPLLAVAALAACSSADDPVTPDPPGGGNGGDRVILDNPSFATNIQDIFDRRGCSASSCHGTSRQAGMDLRSGASYANLVNVQSAQGGGTRVIPGDAQNSYLVVKLEGRQSTGGQMPLGGSPLDNTDLTNIRNWITQGAQNN